MNNDIIELIVDELLSGNFPKQKDICLKTGKAQANVSLTMQRHGVGYSDGYAPVLNAIKLLEHGVDLWSVHEKTNVHMSMVTLIGEKLNKSSSPRRDLGAKLLVERIASEFFEEFETEPLLVSGERGKFRRWWYSAMDKLCRHNVIQQSGENSILIRDLMEKIFCDDPVCFDDPKTGE